MINFVAFSARHDLEGTKFDGPWVAPCDKSDFVHIFSDWEPEVQNLIEVCAGFTPASCLSH